MPGEYPGDDGFQAEAKPGSYGRILQMSSAASGSRQWSVDPAEVGTRLDRFLAARLPASRARVRSLLAGGSVQLDGRTVGLASKGATLCPGQQVAVSGFVPRARLRPRPQPEAPLRLVARGAGWLAVDKPAGQPVHPLAAGEVGTVLNALVARFPEMGGVGEGGLRSGVVHRLDVDTSGVLLFATEEARYRQLRSAFRRHRVGKTYRALVHGKLAGQGELVLELAVGRHRPARVRVVLPDQQSHGRTTRRTTLRWCALAAFEEATLVEVHPSTGFLHQIRVSLAWLGHPVMGDPAYGGLRSALAPRQLLHAAHVAVDDVEAASPDPPDFRRALETLRPA